MEGRAEKEQVPGGLFGLGRTRSLRMSTRLGPIPIEIDSRAS
jgi:hypothetical protein